MDTTRAKDAVARARESRFAQEVVGPKVTKPLGQWLQTALDPRDAADTDGAERADITGDHAAMGHAAVDPKVPNTSAEEQSAEEPVGVAEPALPKGVKAVALAVKDRVKEHNLVVVAAGIAFWGLLAIPAVLFSLVSIGGLVFDADTIKEQVQDQMGGAPEEVTSIIAEQFESVASSPKGGLITGLVVGILLALWTASGAMAKLMGTLNTIYGVPENRKFVKLRGTALAMTLGGVIFMVATMFFLTAFPALLKRVDGVGDGAAWLFSLATYPRYKIITAGAVVATVLWVLAVIGFSVYDHRAPLSLTRAGGFGDLCIAGCGLHKRSVHGHRH